MKSHLETMIVCDGCEGSFHVLCVGKYCDAFTNTADIPFLNVFSLTPGLKCIPEEEWYCSFCSIVDNST
jgi:hypothetical protein